MQAFKSIIFILILSLSVTFTAQASDTASYARTLYDLGIIRGTDKGFESEKTLTRAESAAIMTRLLGKEMSISKTRYKEKFVDVPDDHWAFGYVMFCYENAITKGTGGDTFSPDMQIDARQFVTLLLRLMKYEDASPDNALDIAVEIQLCNSKTAQKLKQNGEFKRGDMFYLLNRSLKTQMYDGTNFARHLADEGVITKRQAEGFDVYLDFENIDVLIDELLDGVN